MVSGGFFKSRPTDARGRAAPRGLRKCACGIAQAGWSHATAPEVGPLDHAFFPPKRAARDVLFSAANPCTPAPHSTSSIAIEVALALAQARRPRTLRHPRRGEIPVTSVSVDWPRMRWTDPFGWVGSAIEGRFVVQAVAGEGGARHRLPRRAPRPRGARGREVPQAPRHPRRRRARRSGAEVPGRGQAPAPTLAGDEIDLLAMDAGAATAPNKARGHRTS